MAVGWFYSPANPMFQEPIHWMKADQNSFISFESKQLKRAWTIRPCFCYDWFFQLGVRLSSIIFVINEIINLQIEYFGLHLLISNWNNPSQNGIKERPRSIVQHLVPIVQKKVLCLVKIKPTEFELFKNISLVLIELYITKKKNSSTNCLDLF